MGFRGILVCRLEELRTRRFKSFKANSHPPETRPHLMASREILAYWGLDCKLDRLGPNAVKQREFLDGTSDVFKNRFFNWWIDFEIYFYN